jgi:hypothetical protein
MGNEERTSEVNESIFQNIKEFIAIDNIYEKNMK